MLALSQLLAAYAPLLLIDSASNRIQVGLFAADGTAGWKSSTEEAGIGIFQSIEALGVGLDEVQAFAFCTGPGSVLGIRTAAMALRTWNALIPRPLFGYSSLALVAEALGRSDVSVVADARRELWHRYQLGGELIRVPVTDLSGELVMPEGFRHWSVPPPGLASTPYLVKDLFARAENAPLFTETPAPDAFLHEEPSYVTWSPQIHRAPPKP
jgi:tRNA threonylcarbamoyladenosine biosynthesis protein TsaB